MLKRPGVFGGLLVILLLLSIAGCAKNVPVSPAIPAVETTRIQQPPEPPPPEKPADLAARRARELQAAIEEKERRVVEESMRRRFGQPAASPVATLSREEFVRQDVHFAFDSYTLSEEAKTLLERKAGWLREHATITIQIEGHCDERGTTIYNLALGERRAHAVRQYLVALGIDPKRLSTISYGEEFPLDPGHNEEAWARNRRAHFVVTSQ